MSNKRVGLYGDGIGCVELVDHLGSDLSVVNSARVSFGVHKEFLEEEDEKLIKYLVKHRHTSTLEHCVMTFRFKVPLFIRSQHHRHRTWSYNEISRRYTSVNLEFYEPKEFRIQHENNRQASNSDKLFIGNPGDSEVDIIGGKYYTGFFSATGAAMSANTASKLVLRDASGNFAAGTITANLQIQNIPFTTANESNNMAAVTIARVEAWSLTDDHTLCCHFGENGTKGTFTSYAGATAGHSSLTSSEVTDTSSIIFSFTYHTA